MSMIKTPSAVFDRLLPGQTRDSFLQDYWQKKVLFVEQQSALTDLIGTIDPVEQAATWARGEGVESMNGATRNKIDRDEALRRIEGGEDVHLLRLEKCDPTLQEVCAAVQSELMFLGKVTVTGILTQTKTTGVLHFDGRGVLNCQVTGTKRWLHAQEVALSWPSRTSFVDAADEELADWQQAVFDRRPKDDDLINLVTIPGSAVYVPAGLWHAVPETVETPSLSVLISFDAISRIEVFYSMLAEHLDSDAAFRSVEPATLETSDDWNANLEHLFRKAKQLSEDDIKIEILSSYAESNRRLVPDGYRACDGPLNKDMQLCLVHSYAAAMYLWDRREAGHGFMLFCGPHRVELEELELFPLMEFVVKHPLFSVSQVFAQDLNIERDRLWETLQQLVDGDVLYICLSED